VAEIDPLAPTSMQLFYELNATASLPVHQKPSVMSASSIPVAAFSASAVSPSHIVHHDRHRTASPQPALHRAASRRSLDSGAAFSYGSAEPALDATTAALNLAAAAAAARAHSRHCRARLQGGSAPRARPGQVHDRASATLDPDLPDCAWIERSEMRNCFLHFMKIQYK
jgi:hypothetical protein